MDFDEDSMSFSPLKEPSPQIHHRRLKRLKKSNSKSLNSSLDISIDDPLLFPSVDFARLEALENDLQPLDFNDSNSSEDPNLSQESLSLGFDEVHEKEKEEKMEFGDNVPVTKTKRVLNFGGDVSDEADVIGSRIDENLVVEIEMNEMRSYEEHVIEKTEEKKKRSKMDRGDQSKNKEGVTNKRREEKERKTYLKELHAESQRLLRESRDAAFKPIPVVQKPISSVLEKIRKRKLEISKKATFLSSRSYGHEGGSSLRDESMNFDVSNEESREESVLKAVENESFPPCGDGENSLNAPHVDELKVAAEETSQDNNCNQVLLDEVHTHAFRVPVGDTQDLFDDSEINETTTEQLNSPMEEEFAPSLLAINLTLDSAPVDDSSSEEEDNDKENINPHPRGIADVSSSPTGDPVKFFVDDEAEEEDDSDHDLARFKENEDEEDIEDFEELNDMIARGYKERPVDNERRNELHQKWLEQQDAAGTDNLMQRLKCGQELRDTFLDDEESESDEGEKESDDEAKENSLPVNSTRVNVRKAKQIVLQMFSDKEDVYMSDDDEDAHRRHAQCLLIRKEEQATVMSPADDESSREVFGLIKKLNILSENKRKPKASSFFDSVLKGGNSHGSSKSSFLGRVSNNHIPSTHKQGSRMFRSFIFGRDDSNSRSSTLHSEDSSDTVSQETRPTKNFTAKYSNSQTRNSGQNKDASVETSGTLLLDILRRQPQSQVCLQENTVDLTKSMLAFRVPKKPVKLERRS